MIWAALSMTAALVMTACSNDDNTVETPAAQQAEVKTIPYSVTVNGGAGTRATVDSDNNKLRFATGDKLYITGTNVKGVLEITSGVGETTGATFSGDLTYTGDAPASDLSLTATLVSAQQTDGTEVTINPTTKAVTVNYPTTAYCDDVATAVQKYSNLTGTSTYGDKSFKLKQQTAFLNFEITFEDGTAENATLSTVVSNGGSALCTANVKTKKDDEKVVAKFVLPVASGTTLSGATVTMGTKAALTINNATLTGKVYNVKKTPVSSVAINNAPTEALFVNSKGTLTATVLPDNATDKTVTWSSSDPDYVSINATTGEYEVMGKKGYGSATITATAGGKTATCTITGKATYTSATIGVGTVFHVGDTYYADGTTKQFHAKTNFSFVDGNGAITLVIDGGSYKFKRGSNGTMIDLGIKPTGSSDGVYIASGAGVSNNRFEIAVHTN